MANNSGGPHCLAEGVTERPHPSPSRSCCRTARVAVLGGEDPSRAGLDLRGAFVGSEGMLGITDEGLRAA